MLLLSILSTAIITQAAFTDNLQSLNTTLWDVSTYATSSMFASQWEV